MKKLFNAMVILLIVGLLGLPYTNVIGMEHGKDDMNKIMENQEQMMDNQQEMMKMMKEMHKNMKDMHQNMERMKEKHMDMMHDMDDETQEKQTEHKHGQ